jgi:hypothetical protein
MAQAPAVFVGRVASGDMVVKSGEDRDRMAEEEGMIAFEMEGAGIWEKVPCLLVKGICDYSDSHKNKKWQNFAAATAASATKALLERYIQADKIRGHRVKEALPQHHWVVPFGCNEDFIRCESTLGLTPTEQRCLQMFRVADYQWYKDCVENRVEGTCKWILNHLNFQSWLKSDSGLLLVSADPGYGKSVLAKFLVNSELPRSATICYFFFREQEQHNYRQSSALLYTSPIFFTKALPYSACNARI